MANIDSVKSQRRLHSAQYVDSIACRKIFQTVIQWSRRVADTLRNIGRDEFKLPTCDSLYMAAGSPGSSNFFALTDSYCKY
jgi:hypothetical protein